MVSAGLDFVSVIERSDVGRHRGKSCLGIFQAKSDQVTFRLCRVGANADRPLSLWMA